MAVIVLAAHIEKDTYHCSERVNTWVNELRAFVIYCNTLYLSSVLLLKLMWWPPVEQQFLSSQTTVALLLSVCRISLSWISSAFAWESLFFFSPGLCENSGQFQTIQTGDCECMQAWLCVCVYECMSDCLYASQRGGGLCLDSIRCTCFNLPPLQPPLPSHASFIWKQSRETKREKTISE